MPKKHHLNDVWMRLLFAGSNWTTNVFMLWWWDRSCVHFHRSSEKLTKTMKLERLVWLARDWICWWNRWYKNDECIVYVCYQKWIQGERQLHQQHQLATIRYSCMRFMPGNINVQLQHFWPKLVGSRRRGADGSRRIGKQSAGGASMFS